MQHFSPSIYAALMVAAIATSDLPADILCPPAPKAPERTRRHAEPFAKREEGRQRRRARRDKAAQRWAWMAEG